MTGHKFLYTIFYMLSFFGMDFALNYGGEYQKK